MLDRFVIRDPVDPPTNRMPLPLKPLIARALPLAAGEKTTLLTFAAITRPSSPRLVPVPSKASDWFTATLVAAESVSPWSGNVPPTAPSSVIACPAESVSLPVPSTVEENAIFPPAVSDMLCWSSIPPANVWEPWGVVTGAATWMP